MKITGIVRIVHDTLWAACFEGNELNEFEWLFEKWRDPQHLERFFIDNKDDLLGDFYRGTSVEKAIIRTIEEANVFEEYLLSAAKGRRRNFNLSDVFVPLHKHSVNLVREKSKAYGTNRKSWLRIYAIRVDKNFYIISGGAIKLTTSMNDREHFQDQFEKLDVLNEFLKNVGIESSEDYGYLDFE